MKEPVDLEAAPCFENNEVVECQCVDCQEMKDKPKIFHQPQINNYFHYFPEIVQDIIHGIN
jgi:hypothetical protein